MRQAWKEVEIKDFGRIVTGKTPPTAESKYFDGEYNFISPKDLDFDSRYIKSSLTTITIESIKKFKNQVLPKNAVMFTALSYGFGKMGLVNHTCLTNQQINSIIVNEKEYNFHFVYYLLRNSTSFIRSYDAGIVTPIVPKSIFEKIKLFVPESKETQGKIASTLSGYDDLIENNHKRIKLLEEKAQLTYEEWFVKMRFPGFETAAFDEVTGLPEGWEEGKLSDLIEYQSGFAFKSSKFKEEGYPIIKIKNIGNNTIDFNNVDYIDITYANQVEKFQLDAGDLLIAMTGATVGKVGIMPKSDVPCYLNQRVGRFVSLKSIDNKAFIECFFNIGSGLNQVLNIAGGAAQPNISANQILSIKTIVPSDTILKDFSQMATSITNSVINLQNQNRLLKEARDILLPRLMSGMIDVEELQMETLIK